MSKTKKQKKSVWRIVQSSGNDVTWENKKTGELKVKKMSEEEWIAYLKRLEEMRLDSDQIFAIYDQFKDKVLLNKKKKGQKEKERKKGYEAMCAAEKFVRKHPEISMVQCDDDFSCSSQLVLVPLMSDRTFYETCLTFIPQSSGELPIKVHLCQTGMDELIDALKKIRKFAKKRNKNELLSCWPESLTPPED